MYDTFAQSEAEFASAYLSYKLERGGAPFASQDELLGAALAFANTHGYGECFPKLKKFMFNDFATVTTQLQDLISNENGDAKKVGVIRYGNKLLPTYDFRDIGDAASAVPFMHYLSHHEFPTPKEVNYGAKINPQYRFNAAAGAEYLTDFLADKFAAYETEHGKGTVTTVQLNNGYANSGQTLRAPENKAFFQGFNQVATRFLADLMTNNDGFAQISNQAGGNLAYNNWCRLLAGFPILQRFIRNVDVDGKEFTMTLTPQSVRVEEVQFAPHLVAAEQADGCRHTQIDLLTGFNMPASKLQHCTVSTSHLAREVNERLRP